MTVKSTAKLTRAARDAADTARDAAATLTAVREHNAGLRAATTSGMLSNEDRLAELNAEIASLRATDAAATAERALRDALDAAELDFVYTTLGASLREQSAIIAAARAVMVDAVAAARDRHREIAEARAASGLPRPASFPAGETADLVLQSLERPPVATAPKPNSRINVLASERDAVILAICDAEEAASNTRINELAHDAASAAREAQSREPHPNDARAIARRAAERERIARYLAATGALT